MWCRFLKSWTWMTRTCLFCMINTLRPRQNGRRFTDYTFKCIFLNENVRISIKISLKFVRMGPINNTPSLVQIMAWHWSGDKTLSEPMMVSLLTHICVTRPQWVNTSNVLCKYFREHKVLLIWPTVLLQNNSTCQEWWCGIVEETANGYWWVFCWCHLNTWWLHR